MTGTIDTGRALLNVWFEVVDELGAYLSDTANPWLVVMLPIALETGGDIESDLPADPLLVENLYGLANILRSWYPDLQPVRFKTKPAVAKVSPAYTASFFSGGIDAWFTALRYSEVPGITPVGHVDEFLTVWGFDIDITDPGEFALMKAPLVPGAKALGKPLVEVATNLRENRTFWKTRWGPLCHGAGLGVVGLILEKRYKKVIAGSTLPFQNLQPWGSHPLTDTLLSTSRLDYVHDGAAFTRFEKTKLIAKSDLALKHLRVCNSHQVSSNCSMCEKCYRSMAALELLGAFDKCESFPRAMSLASLSKVYIGSESVRGYFQEIREVAREYGRSDIASAVDRSFLRSSWRRAILQSTRWFENRPFLWRLHAGLKSLLLRGFLR